MTKTKIMMLSDHPLSTSGVGTQARWIIDGLLKTDRYTFRCFGAAIKHEDYRTVVVNEDFIIKPTKGFGDPNLIRQVLATEKPDALFLFTDPRFFYWVWEMEDEIHQVCPIVYNHLWDNDPSPDFNKVLYESTDLINCINYPTYEMVNEWFPERTNYIPHAVPSDMYVPLKPEDIKMHKCNLIGKEREDHFIAMYVGRNARRKMVNDIIATWGIFLDDLEKKHGHRNATLILHTDPIDKEGANLFGVIEKYGLKDNIIFSKERVGFDMMNVLYNIADVQINRSCNEGFGLPILEGKLAGTPAITIKTGGLGRQIEDHTDGTQYGVALDPEVRNCVGNQMVPYIYEDYVSNQTFANALMSMFDMGDDDRRELGLKCRAHCERDYRMDNMIESWDTTIQKTLKTWRNDYRPWTHKEI